MTTEDQGQRIVATARGWIGTPYRHQASRKGVGCDCLGLVRGIWRELYGQEPEEPAPYSADWAERGGEERLLMAAFRHFGAPLPLAEAREGDVIVLRWKAGAIAKHAGILSAPDGFIHAYEQAAVVESPLVRAWRRRIAGVFRFPPVEDRSA
ncbi:NlpC/P60 family protein [Rhizobium sp. SG2393]|uniref:NlpC/P60 family protein n=1 Tax=Rhizobium sp. SG2393 TaxID=3276279 RepID=UPI00366AB4A9